MTSTATSSKVDAAFTEFDKNLRLDKSEADKARRWRDEIATCLVDAGLARETFGQGSFARKTMRKPLKDVDLVVVLNESLRAQLFGVAGGSREAMRLIHEVLESSGLFPGAVFDPEDEAAHALMVQFPDCPFTYDLVPAFDVAGTEAVDIADREKDTWKRSEVRKMNRVVRERNQATGGLFVHQVRMAKTLKTVNEELDIASLAIESLCFHVITEEMRHDEALAAVFRHASSAVLGVVLDPVGKDVSGKWTQEERTRYSQIFTVAAIRAHEAVRLRRAEQDEAAIDGWQAIFGEDFPAAEAQSAAAALSALGAGSITSTGRAVSSPAGRQEARPVRSWSPR